MCVFMCVCVCVCIYIYIYIYCINVKRICVLFMCIFLGLNLFFSFSPTEIPYISSRVLLYVFRLNFFFLCK